MKKLLLSAMAITGLMLSAAAAAPLFVSGSTFQVTGENTPVALNDTVTLANGTTAIGGGAVNLTTSIVPDGVSQWLVFSYVPASGGLLAGNVNANWSVFETGLDAAQPLNFTGATIQFFHNGVALTPTADIFGGQTLTTTPVPGQSGSAFVNVSFTAPFAAGPLPQLGTFIDPFSFLSATGIDPSQVTSYTEALRFEAQNGGGGGAIPEPISIAVLGVGLAGIGFTRRRRG